MVKKMFLLIVLFVPLTFSGFLFAENDEGDEPSSQESDEITLLQVRDVVLKSTYKMNIYKSVSLPVSVEAEILRGELLLAVENFEGILEVHIVSLSGGENLHEEFFVGGSGFYGMNVSSLTAGNYKIELNLGSNTYVGKFSIEE